MWAKELWEARWRLSILLLVGGGLAAIFPLLFGLLSHTAGHPLPPSFAFLRQYPGFAFGWFGEDLPELLLVSALLSVVGTVSREWQTGTIEFLAQMPMTTGRIAWEKGLWASLELSVVSLGSSGVLAAATGLSGHALPWGSFALSTLVITVGFTAILWLLLTCAWIFHSTYAVILIGIGIFLVSVMTESIPVLKSFSVLTYVSNTVPDPSYLHLWEHLGILAISAAVLARVAVSVAARQEWIANHGRDQG